jgi:hypothetical protein
MSTAASPGAARPSSVRRVVVASLVGTSLEWYDFFIYGTAAALVFNQLFFPSFEPLVGTLLAFATYAVGFITRRWAASSSGTTATRWDERTSSLPRCC